MLLLSRCDYKSSSQCRRRRVILHFFPYFSHCLSGWYNNYCILPDLKMKQGRDSSDSLSSVKSIFMNKNEIIVKLTFFRGFQWFGSLNQITLEYVIYDFQHLWKTQLGAKLAERLMVESRTTGGGWASRMAWSQYAVSTLLPCPTASKEHNSCLCE